MQRKYIVSRLIFISSILFLTAIFPAKANISVNDVLSYEIVSAEVSAEIGKNSVNSKGLSYKGENIPQGSTITVSFNHIGDWGSNGNFSIENKSNSFGYLYNSLLKHILPDFLVQTSAYVHSIVNLWESMNFTNGVLLTLYPYIPPSEENWNLLNETGNDMLNNLKSYKESGVELDYSYIFQDRNNEIYFETWNKGILNNNFTENFEYPFNINANYSFKNRFQIAFNKITGQMLGMHIDGETSGRNENGKIYLKYNYKIEKVRYNLPWFKIKNTNRILVGVFVPIVVISIVSIPVVLITRKRKSKKIENTSIN